MIEHISKYWYIYWGLFASAGFIWCRFKQADSNQSAGKRSRSLLAGAHYYDPESKTYSPGLFGRQLLLISMGLALVVAALLIVWLLGAS